MKETSYYELKMPDSNDTIDVSVLNNNMKRLDDVLILTVIGRTAETSEFVKKCCAPYIMIQNLGEETVTIYDRRWPEDMWEDNKIVIEPTKFHIYRVANSVNANFLVLDNKECNFRYFITAEQAIAEGGGGGGGGTTDYNELDNQPKVNGIVLIGNKSFKELGLLNDDGKIKSDYLPPFVDNMDSYDTEADFPRPGVEDRLYLDKSTNLAYVWAGTDYACIGTPLALGITHETAGYGDESRAAYNHSLSEHARVDATKTEGSSQNGYVKINGEETKVYEHPGTGTNPHGTTKTDVGLGNVLDAKQVTVTEQAYSDTEKAQARKNIGAGTSSFSGKYSDLAEIPSEFTPAEHNHDDLYTKKNACVFGASYDDFVETGFYEAYGDKTRPTTNAPDGKNTDNNYYVIVNKHSDSYVRQTAYSVTIAGIIYTRVKTTNGWKAWERIATDTVLDDYSKKTSVSSDVNSTKSVINVTDAKAQMAMVKSIKGKTQKIVQLVGGSVYNANNCTISTDSSERITVTANNTAAIVYAQLRNKASTAYATSIKDHWYYVRAFGFSPSSNMYIYNDSAGIVLTGGATSVVAQATDAKSFFLRIAPGQTVNATIQVMILDLTVMGLASKTKAELDAMFPSYIPYNEGQLWSTPVESVVSVGKNLCSGLKYGKGINTTTGAEYDLANAACTDFIPVKPSVTIYASGMGTLAANFIAWYDANKNYIDRSGGSNNNLRSQVLPANARYVRLNWYGGVTLDMATNNTIMISYDNSAYIPYNKTTVLVPSAVKNLPDYGLGIVQSDGSILANEVDFENGTYVQKVTKKKIKDISSDWGMPNANSYVYCSGLKDKKPGLYNLLMSTFNNHPNAAAAELLNGECKGNATTETIYFMDKSCASVEAFKAKYGETEIVYELNSHKTTPLSDYLRPLPVEQGGTLTLVNEHNLDVNSTIKYKKEV